MGRLITLSECLWSAFIHDPYGSRSPQDHRQMWAIREGVRRLDPTGYRWSSPEARKDHECERGCNIRRGEEYFKLANGSAWGSELKFCAACMAMILYAADVAKEPAHIYTHWDEETHNPVNPEQDERRKRELQRLLQNPPEELDHIQQKPIKLIPARRKKQRSSKPSPKP